MCWERLAQLSKTRIWTGEFLPAMVRHVNGAWRGAAMSFTATGRGGNGVDGGRGKGRTKGLGGGAVAADGLGPAGNEQTSRVSPSVAESLRLVVLA